MCSDRTKPESPLFKPLVFLGLICLAAITLQERGASLMYATPWRFCYWTAILISPLLLLLRLSHHSATFFFPAGNWVGLVVLVSTSLMAAALLSPYRSICLRWTALPLAGLAGFLVIHDWLRQSPENRIRFADYFTYAAAAVVVAGNVYWVLDLTTLSRSQFFSSTLFEMRNPHPLGHSNYAAGLALLALPSLAKAAREKKGFARIFFGSVAALALLMLFTSGSRGGMLGLVALALAAVGAARFGRRKLVLSAVGAIIAVVVLAIANPRIRALLTPHDDSAEINLSTVQRTAMIEAGIAMAIERPLFGWGYGSTPLAFPRFRRFLEGGAENVLQLHNTPVEILATVGVAGFLSAGVLLGFAFRNSFRTPVAAITLAGYAVFSLSDFQLDVPVFVFAVAAVAGQLAPPGIALTKPVARIAMAVAFIGSASLIAIIGKRDPTPALNAEALSLAQNPQQSARAVELLNQSLEINPDQEIAHFNLGWLLVVSDPVKAEHHFREAMRLVPDKGGVYFGLGLARLNQSDNQGAARDFALECLNEPQFLASPWWKLPAIAARRSETAAIFSRLTQYAADRKLTQGWVNQQAVNLAQLAASLGVVSEGAERNYRRARQGYPVLMRNQDLSPPMDLYDVREDPRFAERVPFPLPHKGWLPTPVLIRLIDGELPGK